MLQAPQWPSFAVQKQLSRNHCSRGRLKPGSADWCTGEVYTLTLASTVCKNVPVQPLLHCCWHCCTVSWQIRIECLRWFCVQPVVAVPFSRRDRFFVDAKRDAGFRIHIHVVQLLFRSVKCVPVCCRQRARGDGKLGEKAKRGGGKVAAFIILGKLFIFPTTFMCDCVVSCVFGAKKLPGWVSEFLCGKGKLREFVLSGKCLVLVVVR